jgi:phosphate starvation-inducible membrane PsiE
MIEQNTEYFFFLNQSYVFLHFIGINAIIINYFDIKEHHKVRFTKNDAISY